MSAGTSELFCLICFLVCSCTALEIISAELGKDVILPCKAPEENIFFPRTAVEWTRPGLDPKFVFLYPREHFYSIFQHPSYRKRVDLQDEDMKHGNVSLILKNVTKNDTGRYQCWVFQRETNDRNRWSMKIETIISLVVVEPGDKDSEDMGGGDKDGGDKDGGNKDGGDKDGEDKDGEDMDGRDKDGEDKEGGDIDGRDMDGGDIDGRDKDGGNIDGRDKDGGDKDGGDKDGGNKDGGDKDGEDKDGEDKDGEDMDGRDKDGGDKDGGDKDVEDMDGGDKDGGDKDGGDMDGGDEFKNIIQSVLAVIIVALASVGFLMCRSLDDQ